MENNSTEISASSTSTETNAPQKPKRIRIPGRKRGVGKKPFEEKISLQSDYSLNYHNEKRAVPILCSNCGRETTKAKLPRHVKSLYCSRHSKDPGEIEELQKDFAQAFAVSFSNLVIAGEWD